ncbi:MAG: hypothetical protein KAV00_01080 [Phycisphaerae bacterium]|nr:hypothetical protein [Phycisphaerae bacterium]
MGRRSAQIRCLVGRMLLAVCSALAIATMTLGAAGFFRMISLLRPPQVGFWEDMRRDARHEFTIKVADGNLVIWYRDRIRRWRWSPGWGPLTKFEFAGIKYSDQTGWLQAFTTRSIDVELPLWMPLLLFSLPPAIAFIRGPLRRHRRRKRNQCVHCGYNLTGLPGPRCPECGETA